MAVAEVTVVPLGTGTPSLSAYVAEVLKIVEDSGLTYQLTPMGTVIQGDPREIMEVVLKMHNSLFSKDIHRVVTTLKIDERRDKSLTMESKVKAVKSKL
jgi:uncharacterized protein (TIGR00106 family)